MEFIHNINLASLLDSVVSLGSAFILGGLIGLERQYRQRTAGLRTNVLVAVGAAMFVDMANRLHGHDGAVHVVAYVVSGVGFLGAGVIMREEGNVRGLNTAATLWGAAAVGATAGADLLVEAVVAALFVLAANTLLRPIVNTINRKPLDGHGVEVTHTIHVIAARSQQRIVMPLLEQILEQASYPSRDLTVQAFGPDDIHIQATLAATSINSDELDALLARLTEQAGVRQAFWNPSTTD